MGPDRPKKGGRDEPKRATEGFKDRKNCIYKNLEKITGFSRFLESRGVPRDHLEAQEGSKEAPTELQKLKKDYKISQTTVRFRSNGGANLEENQKNVAKNTLKK